MERIQLVQSALNEIQNEYHSFFEKENASIIDYVDRVPNKDGNWINVTIKENSTLPAEIAAAIKSTFSIYE